MTGMKATSATKVWLMHPSKRLNYLNSLSKIEIIEICHSLARIVRTQYVMTKVRNDKLYTIKKRLKICKNVIEGLMEMIK